MNKKILVLLILIILVVAVAAGFYFSKNGKFGNNRTNQEKPFTVETNQLGAGQISKDFPVNLAIEPGSQTLQNYESTSSDGRKQSTIVVTTDKALAAAVSDYVKFFESQDWVEIDSAFKSTTNEVTAVMKKLDDRVMIVAQNNTETKQKTVEITLVQAVKSK